MKVVRDLTSDYSKNLMLILSIGIGIFGIGAILGGYSVIKREMTQNYVSTVPASATIEMEQHISTALLDSVKRFSGVKEAERHATMVVRMKVGDKWYPLLLFIIDDFNTKKLNKITHISGPQEPDAGTMLVERTALAVMQGKLGDALMVKGSNGVVGELKISGIVHDAGLAPAWQEQCGYGYITMETLGRLGQNQIFDQMRVLVNGKNHSQAEITTEAQRVAQWLNDTGHHVHEIQVPPPGQHPHQSQMSAVMSIFVVFSYLILILGSILVATGIATLMVKHIRQIGVMKTIGATSSQIMTLYGAMIITLCLLALLIAIPLSRLAAAAFYGQIATLLNLEIVDDSIPLWVPLLQVASGVLIPLLAAALPLIRGSIIPVKRALENYGVSQKSLDPKSWVLRFSRLSFFNGIFRLSIRNVFRQRSRLIMTIGLLAAGGAMFMTAMNVSSAWDENLKRIYIQRLYDVEVRLSSNVSVDSVVHAVMGLEGIKSAEGWSQVSASLGQEKSFKVTHTYPDKGHGSFSVLALPIPTQVLQPTLKEGRWLSDPAGTDVVLNQLSRGSYQIGDQLILTVDGKPSTWNVIGFTEDVGTPATAYVSVEELSKLMNTQGQTSMLRVSYADRSRENAIRKNRQLESLLERGNVTVISVMPVWLLQNAIAAHMKVLVNSLMAMAIMMALVGTLGLMSTMSMNILERTREIGMMRAIGGTPKMIRRLVVWEGLLIGFFSLFLAFSISMFSSTYMGRFIGHMAFGTPLSLAISTNALWSWAVLVIAGSYCATLYPARRTNKITTQEALAYE